MNEEVFNPLKDAIKWWLRISSWAAIIVAWFLIQPDEPDEDSVEAVPPSAWYTPLLVLIARIGYALISIVCALWTIAAFATTAKIVLQLDFGHPWLNWPWWIVLLFWLSVPFIYHFYLLGFEMIVPMLKKK